MGRYCWYTLQGRRDEGVLVISAYRVCQEKCNAPGPLTAYRQQYAIMQAAGVKDPNPRRQILDDLCGLIQEKRAMGYRPILMIDANGDYTDGKDSGLKNFVERAQLCDPYYEKYGHVRTYLHGTSRLDYIFMDEALTHSIRRIGYLGTHEGAPSDHTMAYVDMDHRQMFAGLINRPPSFHSREILIEQEDKVQAYLQALHPQLEAQNIAERVFRLTKRFVEHKATPENIKAYSKLYGQFIGIVQDVANKVGRKKFGYLRSSVLADAGAHVLLMRYANDCKRRGAPPTAKLVRLGTRLMIDIDSLMEMDEKELRKKTRTARKNLWEAQKICTSLRMEYIAGEARARAQAAGDQDWERRLAKMHRKIRENAINRKLTAITKGPRGALRLIQVPRHDWFYSVAKRELYHYHKGVFEAYPAATDSLFYTHHTRKVLPSGIQAVEVGRDDTDKFLRITKILPMPKPLWKDITSAGSIEAELLQRNKMHLEQTDREQGVSTGVVMTAFRENHGLNPMTQAILEGTPITEFTLSPEMAAFFEAMKQTGTEKELPMVAGTITSTEFQEMFKMAREKTSSDARTPNYTLWKCLARSDKIAGFASVLLSLPFVYGFVNTHWAHMTDFMLEKKAGVRHIHTLRIIGKMPAEFNTCLKLIIGKQARDNFEAATPCDEQHGFRPNRSAPDAMMLKLLTFECARMQKCTIGSLQHDMTAHFDRISPEMTTSYGTKYRVASNVMICLCATIASLRRNVETALGVSKGSYGQEDGEWRLGGMVQGKADVPQLSTQQSDIMLKAHKALTYGVHIDSPGMHRSIEHNSVAFADDTDGQVACDTTEEMILGRVIRRLQHSGQTWNDLANLCGGLIAHHKCMWQLLTWRDDSGHLQPVLDPPEDAVVLQDGKGACSVIDYVPPDKPNIGLGFSLCPDGNQMPHFEATISAVKKLCRAATGAHLTDLETRQLIYQRLTPKLSYALHGTSWTQAQCNKINACIRQTLVPMLRLNRNYPSAVLYGPTEFGGIEFPETYTLQDTVQLNYLIKQLRWDKTVANNFLVALDSVQLCAGFLSPLLEDTERAVDYVSPSYIIALRRRLHEMGGYIWIEKSWTPEAQREGDEALMERFVAIPGVQRSSLRQANAVRLYLRVVTIADLADLGGTYIPADMLDGGWQAGSDIKWPFQPKPPQHFWSTFRRCLRQTFCTRTPPHQRAAASMDLDTPLGRWLPVKRNTWFPAYRTNEGILWRRDDSSRLFTMRASGAPGVFQCVGEVDTLPIRSYPIKVQQLNDEVWTHRPFIMDSPKVERRATGIELEHTIRDPRTESISLASDGSVHLQEGLAACAWVIHSSDDQQIKARYLLERMASMTSYRSELEGMYRGLKHLATAEIKTGIIYQWCDNEAAVNRSNEGLYGPGEMLRPDADILLALTETKNEMEETTKVICRHVYGHQDTRKRPAKEPETDEDEGLGVEWGNENEVADKPHSETGTMSLAARLNIECDRIATETVNLAQTANGRKGYEDTLSLPYSGSRALLNINGVWITSEQQRYIRRAKWGGTLKEYCLEKYGWSHATFGMVNWEVVRTVRNKLPLAKFTQTSKVMHGWLPVMHMQAHSTGCSHCPGCVCEDETLDHMFKCENTEAQKRREEALVKFRANGIAMGIPRVIMEAITKILHEYTAGTALTVPEHPSIAAAVLAQKEIGYHLLPRGFVANAWTDALVDFSVDHPERKISGLLKSLWMDVTLQLWNCRNEIAHNRGNMTQRVVEEGWAARLTWYLEHKLAIRPADNFLLDYTEEDIQRMTGRVRKHRVTQLDIACKAYENERSLRSRGQSVITNFFHSLKGDRKVNTTEIT